MGDCKGLREIAVSGIGVFTLCVKIFAACRLQASLTRSARQMRTPRPWRCGSRAYSAAKGKKKDHTSGLRDIRRSEDTHALRLKSELFDLRSGYANPARFASCGENPLFRCQRKRKRTPNGGRGIGVFVRGTKIFRFAAGERAPRRLSLKCEPRSLRELW